MSDDDISSRPNVAKAAEFQRLAIVAVPKTQKETKEPLRLYEGVVVKVEYQLSPSDEEDSTLGRNGGSRSTAKRRRPASCHCRSSRSKSSMNGSAFGQRGRHLQQPDLSSEQRHSRHIHCYRSAKRTGPSNHDHNCGGKNGAESFSSRSVFQIAFSPINRPTLSQVADERLSESGISRMF